jgi:hypothetical protein
MRAGDRGASPDREGVRLEPQLAHERDVLSKAPVLVARDDPVSPSRIVPGVCANRCQMLGPALSASGEPST